MIGPRLNAAGRLSDMSLGIECLITDDQGRALNIAQQLDALNRERREIEAGMQEQALLQVAKAAADLEGEPAAAVSLFDPTGTRASSASSPRASRSDCTARCSPLPAAMAGEIKGSGRSIPGLHLRDALDLVAKRAPGLLLRFGGHAMAAGLTLRESDFARFRERFAQVAERVARPADRTRTLETDGGLESATSRSPPRACSKPKSGARASRPAVRGRVRRSKASASSRTSTSSCACAKGMQQFDAIQFNFPWRRATTIRAAYRLAINDFNGVQTPQLMIEHIENRPA
jgi:single-stranded-DNA-specific exonuclease